MRRTSATALILSAVVAAALAWMVEAMLVMSGRPAVVPTVTLGIALALLGGVLLLLAWPVRQAARGKRRVDYRHATSVLGFAKANAVVGALLTGAALGALAFFATRAVVAGDAVLAVTVIAVGAAIELGAGLLAEHWCVLPPDDEDDAAVTGSAPEPA
ncbi:hypothetical protein ABIB37_000658 [Agrococcus sp. UYP10]|uniref:DUF3180 family protein n=1 Tax=Agrococcus sp. UYP10 TaxID=1756355 RepID=UPI0033988F35